MIRAIKVDKEFDKEQSKVGDNKEVILKRTLEKKKSREEDEKVNQEKKVGCCIIPCTGTGTASSPPADKLIHQVFQLFLPTRLPPTSFHKMGAEQYLLITLKAINH